ncbi:MAG: hypothetical protein ACLPYY_01255 [Acidimicrobiales bacterium]
MRRLVPWAMVGLVVLGAGLGAALGATASGPPGFSPSRWVAALLARTAASGSARFSYTHVSTSASVAYSSRIAGSGEIDFRSGTVQAAEVDHQTEFTSSAGGPTHPELTATRLEFIGIGTAMYQSFEPAGLTALPWTKMSWHRDPSQDLGLTFVGNASIALDELEGTRHVVGVRTLGAATVGGVATTRYEVSTAPVCKPVHPSTVVETQGPSFVWVDAQGRLVQVMGSLRIGGHLPAAVRGTFPSLGLAHPVTTTDTLRLSGFGVPVHIEAPTILRTPNASGGSVIATLTCKS